MKIIPLVTLQTTINGERAYLPPNVPVDIEDDEAQDLIDREFAMPVDMPAPKKVAVKK